MPSSRPYLQTWISSTQAWRDAVSPDAEGEVMDWPCSDDFHTKQGRSTGRFVLGRGKLAIYLKRHWQFSWWTRKRVNWFPQHPITPAAIEWSNLRWARGAGLLVPEPLAVGHMLGADGSLHCFLAIRELTGQLALHQAIPHALRTLSASDFTVWKERLLQRVAHVAADLHARHRYHKDLYLCHYYAAKPEAGQTDPGPLSLIDLHRLAAHQSFAWRWKVKDLAQLLFSTWGVDGLEDRDRDRLLDDYGCDSLLKQAVWFKARRYAHHNHIPTTATPLQEAA
jgi:heptose I phosphotransferase